MNEQQAVPLEKDARSGASPGGSPSVDPPFIGVIDASARDERASDSGVGTNLSSSPRACRLKKSSLESQFPEVTGSLFLAQSTSSRTHCSRGSRTAIVDGAWGGLCVVTERLPWKQVICMQHRNPQSGPVVRAECGCAVVFYVLAIRHALLPFTSGACFCSSVSGMLLRIGRA